MPDPQRDIAPIIEPLAPSLPPAAADHTLAVVIALGALLLILALAWHWRRRAPLRALRMIARSPDPVAGANALAALVASQRATPQKFWQEELEQLRFGPPEKREADMLARLCQSAETFLEGR